MQFPCLLAVAAFFSSTHGADLTIAPIHDVVVLPSQGDLLDSVHLSCRFRNAAVNIPIARWVIQNGDGEERISIGVNRGNYFAPLPIDGVMTLIISEVSYGHRGNYTCQAKNPGLLSTYVSATITLSLELELEVSLVVMNNTDSVEMRCEMSQYIEPDDNLQWFRNGHMINASNSKYQIQFEDGSTPSLINGVRTESRISVLVISDFNQQNDSGCYHCMAINSQKSASIYVSLEEPAAGPSSCEEIETSKGNSSVTKPPSDKPRPTTPGEEQENEEGLLEGVPVVTVAVAASCAGLVFIFLATLLILMCYICWKTKQKTATNQSEYSNTITTINLWNDFSPPLPPRPNERIKRVSHTSDYYMNEGMGPEKQYTSISPYTSMASFPINDHMHLQLPNTSMRGDQCESSYHVYDTPPEESEYKADDEYICIPSHPAHGNIVTFNGDNTSTNNEYIQVSGGNDEKGNHDYINTFATGEGDENDRTSNTEYVHIPNDIQDPIPHHYDNVPSEGGISRDDMATSTTPDEPMANNGSINPTYDRLLSQ